MCGIAGIYGIREKKTDRAGLERRIREMTSAIAHRGPDDEGYFIGDRVALGHRRLSIIDLASGHQPIFNEDKTVCIVYNGEVFNYLELKKELEEEGHIFSTNSDTETILHAYEQWGADFVTRLRGMFAFCIYDSKKEEAVIARDRLGIKPLFYAEYDGRFVFSSEIKSIISDRGFKREIDREALSSYFMFSYIPAPLTIYRGIRKLLPGHILTLKGGHAEIRQYWDLCFEPDRKKKEKDFICESMDLLRESVRMRLMSDVPLGAFLSGGVDSSAVVALMSNETRDRVNTFTIGFGGNTGSFDDERKYARLVAERYSTNHKEYEVLPDIGGVIDTIVGAFDEPFADDSAIPSYYVYELARRDVKVALSGLGGDEAFCGYERYLGFHLSGIYNRVPRVLRERVIKGLIEGMNEDASGGNRINRLKRFVRSSSTDDGRRYMGFMTRLGENYRDALFRETGAYAGAIASAEALFLGHFNADNAREPLNKVFYCDIKTYLPEDILACTDRLSMHHSLEVRVPFLDHKLIEYSATIPPELKIKRFRKKYILKKAVSPLLPEAVISHRKQGFVGPMAMWLKTDLKRLTLKRLSEENVRRHGVLNPQTVKRILDEHFSGRENNDTLIWTLLIFQSWFDIYMSGGTTEGHAYADH